MVNFKVKLNKLASQVIFRPTLKSADKFLDIASVFEDEYKEWSEIQPNNFVLYNPDNLTGLVFATNSTAAVGEGDNQDQDYLKEKITSSMNKYYTDASVKVIRRTGFAIVKVLESEFNYEDLAELLFRKFYSDNPILEELSFDSKPRDVVFVLDGEKDGLLTHVEIGPVRSNEAISRFNSNFTRNDKIELGESNLFIAVDVFDNKEFIANSFDEIKELIEKCQEKANKLMDKYFEYITN